MTGWESPDPAARITPPDPAPTSPEPTAAAEACAARRADIARLLDVLELELDRLDRHAGDDPTDPSPVGILARVRSGLIDTVALLAGERGMQREDVERFLDEAQ